ncbi:hypothetical protein SAMN04487857_12139 [Pseudomonas sp. ok272]|nr:hypothetical protein SAMN04487857_12139 [Pseudomonas sp. ok272]SFN34761.1 hypothetical protein SAMN04487858_12123 [Pseudomonas sp. ok602]
MIRIDSIWLATEPMDMRAGTETALCLSVCQPPRQSHESAGARWAGYLAGGPPPDRAYFNAQICGVTPSGLVLRDFDYYLTKGASGQMFVRFACLIEWIHVVDYRANLVLIQEFVHSVK